MPDQWRWDWLGCETSPYGNVPVRTPNVDRLAERGARFSQCRTNSPLCAPARAALALGKRFHRCGVPSNGYDLDPNRTTVFNMLRNAGYRTLTCGKNDLHKKTTWKGQEGWTQLLGRYGFSDAIDQSGKLDAQRNGATEAGGPNCSYTSYLHSKGAFDAYAGDYRRRQTEASNATADWPSPLERRHYCDDFCGRMALELLHRTPAHEPWLLWVNWPGPHDPFDPPESLRQRYDGVAFPDPIPPAEGETPDEARWYQADHQQLRRNYAAECEGIDEWVGRILDAVAARGELENTVVVFTSDHGEMLGDHGRFLKHVPYEGSSHVPLIIAGPGIHERVQSQELVELIDVSATMLSVAGLSIPEEWDARSLRPILEQRGYEGPHREVQVSQLADWRMICDGRYKLIEVDGGPNNLFDLQVDPHELHDRSADLPHILQQLSTRLAQELA